jgi:hypothetical protein
VLQEELDGAFEIDIISLKRHSSGSTSAPSIFQDFEIWFSLTDLDALTPVFDANCMPGTRTLVYSSDSLYLSVDPNTWFDFQLAEPYWYGGTHNLVVEIMWSGGEELGTECVYTWQWNTEAMRCASGQYDASSGSLTSIIPMLMLSGESSLEGATFAEIKTVLSE